MCSFKSEGQIKTKKWCFSEKKCFEYTLYFESVISLITQKAFVKVFFNSTLILMYTVVYICIQTLGGYFYKDEYLKNAAVQPVTFGITAFFFFHLNHILGLGSVTIIKHEDESLFFTSAAFHSGTNETNMTSSIKTRQA